ncbi:MAG: preprotein translocase subunit SecE [Lachnospiraceae bacterium]|nr:preprotein translocase subunit SecE [Lachnospiraceae bacterium]
MDKKEKTAGESRLSRFFKGVKTEFHKIIWPDRDTLLKQLLAVLCVTAVVAILIAIIDFGAQNLIDWLTTVGAA